MEFERRLIAESQSLIAEVTAYRYGVGESPADVESIIEDLPRKSIEETIDGAVEITMAQDLMSASATFYPPRGSGRPLTTATVYETLEKNSVTFGIKRDAIEAATLTCNSELTVLHDIEVAAGRKPVDEVPPRMQLVQRPKFAPPPDQSGRLDHRARSPLPLVGSGDLLARTVSGTSGANGMTVTGRELPFRVIHGEGLKPGENTVLQGNELRATADGLLHTRGSTVSVSPTLVLEGNLDYHTGNINFGGDVLLSGRVGDGFTIECTGLLHAASTLDAHGISCAKLIARRGLIGHNNKVTRVAGSASIGFVQNARLDVQGQVAVKASVLNSHITSTERIRLGPGSTVIGSVLRAQTGIEAANIGARGAAASELYLGIDFGIDERLSTIRDQTVALTERLQKVRRALEYGSSCRKELQQLETQLRAAMAQLSEEAGELVLQLDRDDEAELVVRGTVHPGTYIEICHRSYLVERKLTGGRFRIDKLLGALIFDPLTYSNRRK